MKKNIYVLLALVGAIAWTGCMREELAPEDPREQLTAAADSVWTVTLQAVKSDVPQTKGLAIGDGDNEGNTTMLKSIWKAGEEVKVFLESTCIGTLTATPDAEDAHKATLSGTVTTTSLVAGTSTITLLTPRETWDYTGQAGTLLEAAGSIEKMYHYTAATGVLVKAVDTENNTITTDNATFVNQQSIFRLSFRYKKPDETKAAIVAKSVTISSERGKLVQSQSVDGTTVTEGPISVTLGTPSSDPFFVALRNGDEADEAVTFTVIDTENATYKGSKLIPAGYKAGGFVSVKNTTLDRLGVSKSETVISTAEGVM
jgi:hypothetical protein